MKGADEHDHSGGDGTSDTCMVSPLADHPQLDIIQTRSQHGHSGYTQTEYRVYNYQRLASGKIKRGDGWSAMAITQQVIGIGSQIVQADVPHVLACWSNLRRADSVTKEILLLTSLLCLGVVLYTRTRVVLYESVTSLPSLGLQVSTTRGVSLPCLRRRQHTGRERHLFPLSTSTTFIPLSDLSTVVAAQGLQSGVAYYMAVITRGQQGRVIAFSTTGPDIDILKEVYLGIKETLLEDHKAEDRP
ncbi:hypothetical protein IAU60_005899 [Kwoniella sp. DSM 27419]